MKYPAQCQTCGFADEKNEFECDKENPDRQPPIQQAVYIGKTPGRRLIRVLPECKDYYEKGVITYGLGY